MKLLISCVAMLPVVLLLVGRPVGADVIIFEDDFESGTLRSSHWSTRGSGYVTNNPAKNGSNYSNKVQTFSRTAAGGDSFTVAAPIASNLTNFTFSFDYRGWGGFLGMSGAGWLYGTSGSGGPRILIPNSSTWKTYSTDVTQYLAGRSSVTIYTEDWLSGAGGPAFFDNIRLTADAPDALIGTNPANGSTLNFGAGGYVLVGHTDTQAITISNNGEAGSTLNGTVANTSIFTGPIESNSFTLGQNQSTNRTFSITPDQRGHYDETVVFDASESGTSTVYFHATGVAPTIQTTTQQSPTRVGTEGLLSATIANVGNGNLSGLGSVSNLVGTLGNAEGHPLFQGDGGSFDIADGGSQSYTYTYQPVERGSDALALTLNTTNGSPDGMNHAIVDELLQLTGTAVGPQFQAIYDSGMVDTGATLNLTSVAFNDTGTDLLNITNSTPDPNGGDASLTRLTIHDYQITGDDAAMFSLNNFTHGMTLDKGDLSALGIIFNAGDSLGFYDATLTLFTDEGASLGGDGNDHIFNLSAAAVRTAGSIDLIHADNDDDAFLSGDRVADDSGANQVDVGNLDILGQGNFELGSQETLNLNGGNGTLFIDTEAQFAGNGIINGNVINAGLLRVPIDANAAFSSGITNQSGGTVDIGGHITAGTVNNHSGGLFDINAASGTGGGGGHVVIDTGNFSSSGMIHTQLDASLEITGSFTQTQTGQLRMFIAGDQPGITYSQLSIGQTVDLAGQLQIVLQPELFDYIPEQHEYFDLIIAADGINIDVDNFQLLTLITADGASRLDSMGLAMSAFHSGISQDPDTLWLLDEHLFTWSLVNDGTTLRVQYDNPVVPMPTAFSVCIGWMVMRLCHNRKVTIHQV